MEFKKFEDILKKTINDFGKIDKFGYMAITGSENTKNDLDFIIIPSPNTKKGDFLKLLCNFLEKLKNNIKNKKSKLIVFTHTYFQNEVEFLSKRTEKDIFLHVIGLADFVPGNEKVIDSFANAKRIYYGKKENLYNVQKTNLDSFYIRLFIFNCFYSNYPKELETQKIQDEILYIFKWNDSKIDFEGKSNKQIYFECCDF